MAGLARTQRANTFKGKPFVKGFSTMLVPTRQSGDWLLWQLLYNKNGSCISYLNNTLPHAENVSISNLENARHVVGWCSEARNSAGASGTKYTIARSRLAQCHAGCALEEARNISGERRNV
ncbi:hypothetical protein B0J11DRAFT_532711 [Dendryphion nanum]|uniref:Uncharacterized protein n=1 Tax=Dendryphion nanum TaxID=256645 RepID=A0A9P9DKB2_9PLEO|nr:hypothetical protein B0J11DRAFT_532711 [Dendryphion nanum]